MKRILTALVLFAGFMFLAQGMAQATTFSFGDESIYWPGWGNGTSDDGSDYIGHPNILGGGGGTTDSWGNLTEIHFDYINGSGLHAGDVFIDVGADSTWDYVIASGIASGKSGLQAGVYSCNIALNADAYVRSNAFYGNFSGNYREDHPVALSSSVNPALVDSSINVTDFSSGNGQVAFSGLDNLSLGNGPFIIGFAPTCANDVVYEQVPEPATLLLLGLGLFGMGIVSRKRFFAGRKG